MASSHLLKELHTEVSDRPTEIAEDDATANDAVAGGRPFSRRRACACPAAARCSSHAFLFHSSFARLPLLPRAWQAA